MKIQQPSYSVHRLNPGEYRVFRSDGTTAWITKIAPKVWRFIGISQVDRPFKYNGTHHISLRDAIYEALK